MVLIQQLLNELMAAFVTAAITLQWFRTGYKASIPRKQGKSSKAKALLFGGWITLWIKKLGEVPYEKIMSLKTKQKRSWYKNTPIQLPRWATKRRRNISRTILRLQILISAMSAQTKHNAQAQ